MYPSPSSTGLTKAEVAAIAAVCGVILGACLAGIVCYLQVKKYQQKLKHGHQRIGSVATDAGNSSRQPPGTQPVAGPVPTIEVTDTDRPSEPPQDQQNLSYEEASRIADDHYYIQGTIDNPLYEPDEHDHGPGLENQDAGQS